MDAEGSPASSAFRGRARSATFPGSRERVVAPLPVPPSETTDLTSALKLIPALAPIVGGAAVLAWRYQETRAPVTARSIVVPPLAMSTGFAMFLVPAMRVPWSWAITAFLAGALLLSWPLARSSSLEREGDRVVLRRSGGFLLVLLGLLALRLLLHDWIGHLLSARQTASVLFVLAFGMILRWRIGMYRRYLSLVERPRA